MEASASLQGEVLGVPPGGGAAGAPWVPGLPGATWNAPAHGQDCIAHQG